MYCVYKLTDKNGLVYYGSSDNPNNRFSKHKSSSNSCCSKKMDIYSMKMEIMEEDIATENEALWRERGYFDNNECINENRPILSQEEREMYYENNKEERLINQKEYYDNNKEAILINRKEYYEKNKEVRKEYYEKNKEQINKQRRGYRERNKEQLSKQKKEYYKRKKEIKLMGLEDKIEI